MTSEHLASLSLVTTTNRPELFARKVVVIAYTLIANDEGTYTPYFLLSIICPKQKYKSLAEWNNAKAFRLPSGYSLIKGTREMIYAGQRLDIPSGFGRYFNPSVWDSDFQISSQHHEIVARIDGVMPAVSTAVMEAKEEAGVKAKHIKQLFDLGVITAKLDGRSSQYHCFAMQLNDLKYGKAIDSLGLNYFSYQELKWAHETRVRYNIPLARPQHYQFIRKMRKQLKALHQSQGLTLSFAGHEPTPERQEHLKTTFKKLIKRSAKGLFTCYKTSQESSIKRVIKRSNKSRKKVRQLQKIIAQSEQ